VPVYWSLAFIVAASIPNFFGLTSVIAAFCILQFTYTFPPILAIGYFSKKNAIRDGEGFDPATGNTVRHDNGLKRFVRGFMSGPTWNKGMNVWNVLYFLGALVTAGLGAYSAIKGLMVAFTHPGINAFTCHSPLDGI